MRRCVRCDVISREPPAPRSVQLRATTPCTARSRISAAEYAGIAPPTAHGRNVKATNDPVKVAKLEHTAHGEEEMYVSSGSNTCLPTTRIPKCKSSGVGVWPSKAHKEHSRISIRRGVGIHGCDRCCGLWVSVGMLSLEARRADCGYVGISRGPPAPPKVKNGFPTRDFVWVYR